MAAFMRACALIDSFISRPKPWLAGRRKDGRVRQRGELARDCPDGTLDEGDRVCPGCPQCVAHAWHEAQWGVVMESRPPRQTDCPRPRSQRGAPAPIRRSPPREPHLLGRRRSWEGCCAWRSSGASASARVG
eukprot:5676650-Pleurochrysis_carterae.AAC.1